MTLATTTSPRTRLAAAVVAVVLGAAAPLVVASAPAFATSADTNIILSVSKSTVHTGESFLAAAAVSIGDGTPPAGTVTIFLGTNGGTIQELSAHINKATTVSTNISDWPVGPFEVYAKFKPDSAIDQGPAQKNVTVIGHAIASLALNVPKLIAGQTNKIVATVTSTTNVTSFGGSVSLDVGTTSGVASCTPQATSAKVGSCTLTVPAQPAGTVAANALFTSPNFDDANYSPSLTFVAAPAAKPGSSSSGSSAGTTATSSGSATPTPSASTTPSASPSASPTAVAISTTSSNSMSPILIVVIVLIALALVAAVITLVVTTRRRRAAATPGEPLD